MKKIILTLLSIVSVASVFGQFAKDTVTLSNYTKGGVHILKDSILNTGTDSMSITWSVQAANISLIAGHSDVQVCDPWDCYPESLLSTPHTGKIAPGKWGIFQCDIKSSTTAANGVNYVTVVSNKGNATFRFITWPASLKDVEGNRAVTIYPNPASDYVNIVINNKSIQTINVLNVVGRKIAKFNVDSNNNNPIHVPLDNISNGIYLLQFTDEQGKLIGVRRVTKQ